MSKLPELFEFLETLPVEDRANLQKLIGAGFGDSPKSLTDHLVWLRTGFFGQNFYFDNYKGFLLDIVRHLKLEFEKIKELSIEDIEKIIVQNQFRDVWNNLPAADKKTLENEFINISGDKDFIFNIFAGTGLFAAKLSGFQIYLMATTLLGAFTNALGIVLPFVVYTTLTRAISIAIGPIGWTVLLATTIWQMEQPNFPKIISGVIYIALCRNKNFDLKK